MGTGILRVQIVAIIRGHQGDRELPAHFPQRLINGLLGLNTIVLNLQIEITLAKHGHKGARNPGGLIKATCLYQTRDLTVKASAQGDQAFAAIGKNLLVHPGLVVETLQMSRGNESTKIMVSLTVLCQQDQVEHPPLASGALVKPAPASNIELAPDDRLDAGLVRLFIKLDNAIHRAMISDGHGIHPVGSNPLQKRVDADCSVKEAILRVDMEVDKRGGGHHSNR